MGNRRKRKKENDYSDHYLNENALDTTYHSQNNENLSQEDKFFIEHFDSESQEEALLRKNEVDKKDIIDDNLEAIYNSLSVTDKKFVNNYKNTETSNLSDTYTYAMDRAAGFDTGDSGTFMKGVKGFYGNAANVKGFKKTKKFFDEGRPWRGLLSGLYQTSVLGSNVMTGGAAGRLWNTYEDITGRGDNNIYDALDYVKEYEKTK